MTEEIKIGKNIFKQIPKEKTPFWGSLILSILKNDDFIESNTINELQNLIQTKEWNKAHKQFSNIRELTIKNNDSIKEPFLILCEKIAKITYNASNNPAPFDNDSGYAIYGLALKYAKSTKSQENIDKVLGILNLFQQDLHQSNFFSILTKNSGNNLLKNIFNSKDNEMILLRRDFAKNCKKEDISLENASSRIHFETKNLPKGSFEFQYDIKYQNSKIGYYSLIWDNEVNLMDEFLVIK